MPLLSPNLDDRDFNQLVEEARRQIQQTCPDWTDLSPGDPGIVLLEVFAHLTEIMIYRLNRVPEKAYIEFLRLIGVRIHPPASASVTLRFSRSRVADQPVEIPRGARVTMNRTGSGSEPPVFVTARAATIPAGESQVEVLAHHCDLIEGERVASGTGQPGLSVTIARPPIIAPTGDELDLIVAIEARPTELDEQAPVIQYNGKAYRIWREVDSFTNLADRFVYLVDRAAGVITFAPAARLEQPTGELPAIPQALAAIPPADREIRVWYRRGGGPDGDVAANTLTVLKDQIAGVEVTNPSPASGGQPAENVSNALVRGPQELHSLHRAITARDFELVALYSSRSVARAKAITRAALWAHAAPGTVEVLLVPYVPEAQRGGGQLTAEVLRGHETEAVRAQIQAVLEERSPVGIADVVSFARYKKVQVSARIVVRREEDPTAVKQRVIDRLHQIINPLPIGVNSAGWPFGQALRASHVYDIPLAEPGVLWVDRVRLIVEAVPDQSVASVAADVYQPHTWYAGSGSTLYRSLNDGEGWEPIGEFAGEQIKIVRAHPDRAGCLAAATQLPNDAGSRLHLSFDCGESWFDTVYTLAFNVRDVAWLLRNNEPVVLLATDKGLYELALRPGVGPVQVLVDPQDQDRGFYAIAASKDVRGQITVAVATQSTGGLFLSSRDGQSNSFRRIGLQGEDIRVLAVQYDGPRSFLWAGGAAAGDAPGSGCYRWELRGSEDPPEGWRTFNKGWDGGSCRALTFLRTGVMAATHHRGVMRLNLSGSDPAWAVPDVRCGLPLRDPGRFHPVDSAAADPAGLLVVAGGIEGVYRSGDNGLTYQPASNREFPDKVTLPATWLFCSGAHDISVVSEDEAERD